MVKLVNLRAGNIAEVLHDTPAISIGPRPGGSIPPLRSCRTWHLDDVSAGHLLHDSRAFFERTDRSFVRYLEEWRFEHMYECPTRALNRSASATALDASVK